MTNGEKIQSLFPNKCPHVGFNEKYGQVWIMENGKDVANFTLDWWNAEYKEPTTNNDLGVDCISRADVRSLVVKIDRKYMFSMSGKAFQDLYKGIDALPSVTPQPRKGHWKHNKCDVCGASRPPLFDNYCPNCGSYNGGASNGNE